MSFGKKYTSRMFSNQHIASTIFRKAATYIRKYGWQVSGMSQDGKPRCSMGALESASKGVVWNKSLGSLMYQTLYKELNGETLTEFNHRVRNGESVAELFEKVAILLENNSYANIFKTTVAASRHRSDPPA